MKLTPRATPLAVEDRRFQQVVKALFAARRKTLRNGLSSVVGRDHAAAVCEAAARAPASEVPTFHSR